MDYHLPYPDLRLTCLICLTEGANNFGLKSKHGYFLSFDANVRVQ